MSTFNSSRLVASVVGLTVAAVGGLGCLFADDELAKIVLDPPSGTYDHGLMVAFYNPGGKPLESNPEIKVEGGDWEELLVTRCFSADLTEVTFCYAVDETISFSVRELDVNVDAPVTHWDYVIEPLTLDVVLNDDTFDELRTSCNIHRETDDDPNARLYVKIRLQNTTVLDPEWLAWVELEVPYTGDAPPVGEPLVLDTPETARVLAGNAAPGSYSEHYHATTGSPCTVTITEFTRGDRVAGTIQCGPLEPSPLNLDESLGPTVTVGQADWVCDAW